MRPLTRHMNQLWSVIRENKILIPYIAVIVTLILALAVRDVWW